MTNERPAPLPELARSLRTLGRSGDAATDVAHAVVFAPLLEARARAGAGGAEEVLQAFRGALLAARMEGLGRTAAVVGQVDPARGRARAAAVRELLEPLRAGLMDLDALADAGRRDGVDSAAWAAWVAQLQRVFTAADVACQGIARAVAVPADAPPETPSRWFGGARGGRR